MLAPSFRASVLRRCGMACLAAVLAAGFAAAAFAFDFPPLTGRVVDQANIISAESRSDIEAKSKALEDKSGIQLVVATVKSLQGSDVETYANELFRFWKLGQAQKNNGVLLLVAPAEHKVRIEVGYGLEGTLTDALSSVIISSAMVPRFRNNDYSGGIERGVDGIISVLTTDAVEWQRKVNVRADEPSDVVARLLPIVLFIVIVLVFRYFVGNVQNSAGGRYVRRNGHIVFVPFPTGGWTSSWGGGGGGFGDGGGFGGGFGGGGGSSGGGGASGGW